MISERDPFGNKSERAVIGIRSDAPVYTAVGPVMALQASAAQTWEMVRLTGSILGKFVTGQRSIKDMGGPVTIAQQSGEPAALGIGTLIFFTAFTPIHLGLIHPFPFPMLDGVTLAFFPYAAL